MSPTVTVPGEPVIRIQARETAHRSHVRQLFLAAVLLLTLVMMLLPLWSFPAYSLLRNTTSHLGAQGSPYAWVMNLTFVAVGLTSAAAGWQKLRRYPVHVLVIGVFGLSLVLAGLFQHEPLVASLPRQSQEARFHSLFATTTGISFTILSVATAFISVARRDRLLALLVAVLATGLSMAMFGRPELMGLFQRLMFLACFGWLVYLTSPAYRLR